ncbi:MAG: hypothetical protein MI974_13185 [Chitinophagales bacterium]|nr:hypothetical protein [Chitinophagales bacterium]
MTNRPDFQHAIVTQILNKYQKQAQAIDALMKLLQLKKDAVYRRINGERKLTPDEISILAAHYQLDINKIVGPIPGNIQFSFNHLQQPVKGYMDYLIQLETTTNAMLQVDGLKVYYATQEIPIFLYMLWPELVAFKFYIHGLTSWSLDYVKDTPFSFGLIPFHELEIARKMAIEYQRIDSIELWSPTILDNTINQIRFVADIGQFKSKKDALDICHYLEELIQFAQQSTERGYKRKDSAEGFFHLYSNELASTGNTILAVGENRKQLYTSFATPNFLVTDDEALCDYMEGWFQIFIKRSVYISQHSGAATTRFFAQMKEKVKRLRAYL